MTAVCCMATSILKERSSRPSAPGRLAKRQVLSAFPSGASKSQPSALVEFLQQKA
jgi:hypothetical protein